jgi:hypothetical protein
MARYRTRVTEIDAVQFDGTNQAAVRNFTGQPCPPFSGALEIRATDGTRYAVPGDWVVRTGPSDYLPLRPELFDAKYEAV